MSFIRTPFGGNPENERVITSSEQFNNAVNGVITVPDNQNIVISGEIDLQGNRIVCGRNVSISGKGTENNILKSTGLTDPLITSNWSVQLFNVTISAAHAYDLDATGNSDQNLDWFKVNFLDCATVGTIKNYDNSIMILIGYLDSDNVVFDGNVDTIAYTNTIFTGTGSGTSLVLPSSLTISRRIRITESAFVSFGSQIGIDYQGATIPNEDFILNTVNFSGGATYVNGVTSDNIISNWKNCEGITNSASISYMTMNGNATATTIGATGTPVKISGTTTSQSITQKFTNTNNRATYNGGIVRAFKVTSVISALSGNNNQIGLYIAKNGTVLEETEIYATTSGSGRAESIKVQGILQLATNDYIELFVENNTATNDITVQDLSTIIEEV